MPNMNIIAQKEINYMILCRFCLRIITKAVKFSDQIRSPDGSTEITLYSALADVVPEISTNISEDTISCSDCAEKLKTAFFFRILCIQTELDITQCAARTGIPCSAVKLSDVLLRREQDKNVDTSFVTCNTYIEDLKDKNFDKSDNIERPINVKYEVNFTNVKIEDELSAEVQEIIENIPEIEDPIDVPEFLDLNSLAKYIPADPSMTTQDLQELKENIRSVIFPKYNIKLPTTKPPHGNKKLLLYPCKLCNRALRSLRDLEEHMATHYIMRNACNKCPSCGLYVPKSLVPFHMDLHNKVLLCNVCKIRLDVKMYVDHMKCHFKVLYSANPTRKFCGICYHPFPAAFFDQHLDIHKLGIPVVTSNHLKCQICSNVFDFSKFDEHMKLHKS